MLASGIESGRQSLDVLSGLRTGKVYFLRRRTERMKPLKKLLFFAKNARKKSLLKMQPAYLREQLRALPYQFDDFVSLDEAYYDGLVRSLCQRDPDVLSQMERKRPSTGVIAVALGWAEHVFDRYVLAGFSFELTHAYGHNPEIDERGTQISSHADTDIRVLRHLARHRQDVFTSEPLVHERTGLPFLSGGAPETVEASI